MNNLIITNNNPKEIEIKSKYDFEMKILRIDVKLKKPIKKGKEALNRLRNRN